jgi:phage-related protein (TIGR01555 family)
MKRIRAKKPITIDRATRDTFVNFAAKTGIGTNNLSTGNSYGFNPISRNRTLIEWMYRGSWICGVAVDCVADDMTREGVNFVSSMKPEDKEAMEDAERRMQIWQSLNQVAKWSRLYGGCLGYIAIEGQDSATPLRIETVRKGQFQGITALDRWMVTPDLTHSIRTFGPSFGLPEFYDVIATSFQFPFPRERIHHSRIVRMEGIELPFWQKQMENMWGISILERIYDRLTAFDSTTQGAAQLAFKAYLRTYKIKGLRSIIAAGGPAYEALTQQIELTRLYQSNEGLSLMDSEDEFEAHQYTFSGLDDIMTKMAEQISGATQIPLARLFGQSPSGLNTTGDHDLRTYYDNIKRQQERWFRRPLDVVYRVLAASEEIKLEDGFNYDFNSLWQTTDDEKSTIDQQDTAAVMNVQSSGIVGNATILKELRQRGRVTGRWSSITDEDIEEAEKADALPKPSELLGGPQAGEAGEAGIAPEEGEEAASAPAKEAEEGKEKLKEPATVVRIHREAAE